MKTTRVAGWSDGLTRRPGKRLIYVKPPRDRSVKLGSNE